MDPYWGSEESRRQQQGEGEEEEDAVDDSQQQQQQQQQYPLPQNNNVMTDEQIEELRKQIVAYKIISEQLVQMFKTMSAAAQHDPTTGMRLVNPYYDQQMLGLGLGSGSGSSSVGQKMSGNRYRWTPTQMQLEMLESIYNEEGTPTKQKIKDITAQLAQHGQISQTNVYNWFQNRRARSKRKQTRMHRHQSKPTASAQPNAAKDKAIAQPDNPAQEVDQTLYLQNSDTGPGELTGKVVESSQSCDSYCNLAEQFGLPG